MAFKIEIEHNNKVIGFGPRTVGSVGQDVLAVKVALGLIKLIEDGQITSSDATEGP